MNINKIAIELTKDILVLFNNIKNSDIGINEKVNSNTLTNSKVLNKVNYQDNNELTINLIFNDYVQYINNGRKPNSKFPPIQPIVTWAKQRGIPTDNNTIYLIRRAIARDGIKARPIIDTLLTMIDKEMNDTWFDNIFNHILNNINKYFNK